MKIKKFRNKNGWVKLVYRKKFWLFGNRKFYFITSGGLGGHTNVYYNTLQEAKDVYNVIEHLLKD